VVALVRERRPAGLVALALAAAGWAVAQQPEPLVPAAAGEGLVGLDWLIVDGLVVVFVILPLERFLPHRPGPLARPEWQTDARYFVVNHLAVHALGLFAAVVAASSLGWAHARTAASGLAAMPVVLQVLLLLVVTDLVQYWLHRMMHEVPWMWRFHAVHHSSKNLDALAGSRIHLLETLVTRSAIFAAFHALGLPFEAFLGYAAIIALQGTFIHANVRLRYGWLEHVIVSPRYHHWHHASDAEAIDTNYAGTFPFLDRLFGTHHLPSSERDRPERWPLRYGVVKEAVPTTLVAQQRFPFARAAER
ncbi:MAG: sterol desaturase family protein, partial [Myxococcota bacterium]